MKCGSNNDFNEKKYTLLWKEEGATDEVDERK